MHTGRHYPSLFALASFALTPLSICHWNWGRMPRDRPMSLPSRGTESRRPISDPELWSAAKFRAACGIQPGARGMREKDVRES